MQKKIALVSGGNQGIGLAMVKVLSNQNDTVVWMGARDLKAGEEALQQLNCDNVKVVQLDVTNLDSIKAAKQTIIAEHNRCIDVLVNNAGVLIKGDVLHGNSQDVMTSFDVNVMGAYHLIRAFVPEMIAQNYGRILNVSSAWGSFAAGFGGPFAYCMSKAALNALTVILSQELPDNVKVNAASPGWVQTRMVGFTGHKTPIEAAESLLWLTQLPPDGPSGKFFRGHEMLAW
jgi:NAD(P)-dependent dehydrogenase (short-subunit alcohol dehydrogenase family)